MTDPSDSWLLDARLRELKRAADQGGMEERTVYAAAMTRAGRCWLCGGAAQEDRGSSGYEPLPPCCDPSCHSRRHVPNRLIREGPQREVATLLHVGPWSLCQECPHAEAVRARMRVEHNGVVGTPAEDRPFMSERGP